MPAKNEAPVVRVFVKTFTNNVMWLEPEQVNPAYHTAILYGREDGTVTWRA